MGSRKNLRVDCYSPCTLNFECNNYHAKLVNISIGGALISVEGDVLSKLHVGDECDLMLCDKPDLCLAKYSCKVISQNSSEIGVNFQGIHL
ncbi:MAG: PilZ domain-containing protein [Desulfuromonadaceae bacterium]